MGEFFIIKSEAGRFEYAHSRQSRVGVCHLQERDLRIADGEAQAVGCGRLLESLNANAVKKGMKWDRTPDRIESSHRSNVERIRESISYGYRAMKFPVVVDRQIEPFFGAIRRGNICDNTPWK